MLIVSPPLAVGSMRPEERGMNVSALRSPTMTGEPAGGFPPDANPSRPAIPTPAVLPPPVSAPSRRFPDRAASELMTCWVNASVKTS